MCALLHINYPNLLILSYYSKRGIFSLKFISFVYFSDTKQDNKAVYISYGIYYSGTLGISTPVINSDYFNIILFIYICKLTKYFYINSTLT